MTQLRVVAGERNRNGNKPDPGFVDPQDQGLGDPAAMTELLLEVVGPYALPDQIPHDESERWNEPPIGPDWAGPLAPQYFNYRKISIYGGTNEIQHNIIAKAILGLVSNPGLGNGFRVDRRAAARCADSVERLFADHYAFEARKRYLHEPGGWSRAQWKRYAELGLLGLPFAEEHGGSAAGRSRP